MLTTEANFQSYTSLADRQMKVTTCKSLSKYWMGVCKRLQVPFQRDSDGYLLSIDSVGPNFLFEIGVFVENPDEVDTMRLGDLLISRDSESEYGHMQFEIQPTKVESVLNDATLGLARNNPLHERIGLAFIPGSDEFVIFSGRHRTVALATLVKSVEGYEDLLIPVDLRYPKTLAQLADMVTAANGSRNMTMTEKAMVKAVRSGQNLSVFQDTDDFAASALKLKTLTDFKNHARLYGVALVADSVVDNELRMNTVGDLFYKVIAGLTRKLDSVAKGTAKAVLPYCPPDSEASVYNGIMVEVSQYIINNWATLREEAREEKAGKDGEVKVSYNISRNIGTIAEFVADVMFSAVSDQLAALYQKLQADKEEAKANKAVEKEVKGKQAELNRLQTTRTSLVSLNLDTAAVDQAIAKLTEQMEAELAQLQEADAQSESQTVSETENQELRQLLG
jgi:hypothetical protein